ncbi:hypothetical protein GOP47_0028585 [Adiantum capillus-veneris]|nr:hypothetical protein GOP47_0028585 [Adiantum capillus-veneris]
MDIKQEGQNFDENEDSTDEEIHANNDIIDDTTPSISEYVIGDFEIGVPRGHWAIRRMPQNVSPKCLGVLERRRCENVMQSRSPGLVAP